MASKQDQWYRMLLEKKPPRAWLENVVACAERSIVAATRERDLAKLAIRELYPEEARSHV
jgi:hypothetical protein